MAQRVRSNIDFDDEGAGSSVLVRFLVWGGVAAIAIGTAALAAQSPGGAKRFAAIFGGVSEPPNAARGARTSPPAQPSEATLESRRLAESVRALAADRDRLAARLDAIERSLDTTGSIPRDSPPAAPPAPAAPLPPPNWSLVPGNIPLGAGVPSNGISAGSAPPVGTQGVALTTGPPGAIEPSRPGSLVANEQASESVATKTEFAVDLGGDHTFEGLRALWAALKNGHAALFEGLRPVVAVREAAQGGGLELRLVVGPLSNASAAARLCAALTATGLPCQPTVFDGQRFALR